MCLFLLRGILFYINDCVLPIYMLWEISALEVKTSLLVVLIVRLLDVIIKCHEYEKRNYFMLRRSEYSAIG